MCIRDRSATCAFAADKVQTVKTEAYAHPTMFGSQVQETISADSVYIVGGKMMKSKNQIGIKNKDNVLVDSWVKDIMSLIKDQQPFANGQVFNPKMPVLRSELAVILSEGFELKGRGSKSYSDIPADYWAKGLEELGETEVELDMIVDADDAPQKVAQVLKEQWETALPGLTVNLVVEPKKQRVEDMQNGNFQLGLTRWGPDYADPMTYLGMWVTDNSNNYGLWSNADYDAIIDECTTGDLCTDAEGRWARLYDAEKIVMDEAVIYPLYTQCNAEMLSSKVTGVEYHPVAINRVYKDAVKTE